MNKKTTLILALSALLLTTACKGRRASDAVPSGDTVEVNIDCAEPAPEESPENTAVPPTVTVENNADNVPDAE